jgi:hypothetical protein
VLTDFFGEQFFFFLVDDWLNEMEAILLAAGMYFLYSQSKGAQTLFPGDLKPTSPEQLPPVNRLNPGKNDIQRVPTLLANDPMKIGYTERTNVRNMKSFYPAERRLGMEAVYKANAPYKRQDVQDAYVQQQGAYILPSFFLDTTKWNTGVKPFPKANFLGNPQRIFVKPVATVPTRPT